MGSTTPDDGLSVRVSPLLAYALATLEGSIDFGTHALLEARLTESLALTKAALIVDMAEVEFCDSSGLNSFVRIIREARQRGVTLVVVGMRGRVANVFNVTRIAQELYLKPDLETAIRWLETGRTGDAS